MRAVASMIKGLTVTASLIMIYTAIRLMSVGDKWLGFSYLLIGFLTFSSLAILHLKTKRFAGDYSSKSEKWRHTLYFLQGAVLACWIFDIATTFYAINITRLAKEINPLGWPLGILGALAFYGPVLILTGFLMRSRETFALYGATACTILAFFMGTMNFNAGAQNLVFFLNFAVLPSNTRLPLAIAIVCANLLLITSLLKLSSANSLKIQTHAKNRLDK